MRPPGRSAAARPTRSISLAIQPTASRVSSRVHAGPAARRAGNLGLLRGQARREDGTRCPLPCRPQALARRAREAARRSRASLPRRLRRSRYARAPGNRLLPACSSSVFSEMLLSPDAHHVPDCPLSAPCPHRHVGFASPSRRLSRPPGDCRVRLQQVQSQYVFHIGTSSSFVLSAPDWSSTRR